jgi:glycosyltransferase involved in cell wall biosynthesis
VPPESARAGLTVLHVSQPTEAGVAACVLGLVADQRARGWDVSLAAPFWDELAGDAEKLGARCHRWEANRAPGPASLWEAMKLGRIMRRVRPDVVHLHSSKAGLAGRLYLRGRLPTIFQPHAWSFDAAGGIVGRTALRWERFAARYADVVVCVSEAEEAEGRAAGVHARYEVVPNGVRLEDWRPAGPYERRAARSSLELGEGPIAVCVGRLTRQKGQDLLLDAWPAVRERVAGARLVLVGSGPEEGSLRTVAGDGVELVGASGDPAEWYAAADVVVAASRWEGMSLVPLEAMATGRSVVATDVSGAREAIGDRAGAIVPIGDIEALVEAIAARLIDRDRADREGEAGRQRVEASFDVRLTTEKLAALAQRVAARDGASTPSSSTEPTIP